MHHRLLKINESISQKKDLILKINESQSILSKRPECTVNYCDKWEVSQCSHQDPFKFIEDDEK